MDIGALSAAAGSFKVAVDMAKGIHSLTTSTEVREKTSALLDAVVDGRFKLLEATDTQAALLTRIKELEDQIAGFEDWNSEKQRYQLKSVDRGAFAYMHKPGMQDAEPAVWLCQTCFEKRHKSPLQFRQQIPDPRGGRGQQSKWGCNLCKAEITVYYTRSPSAEPWEPKDD